jgi:hypothetical protein
MLLLGHQQLHNRTIKLTLSAGAVNSTWCLVHCLLLLLQSSCVSAWSIFVYP